MLKPATGPEDPPSSRPHAGVLGGQVFAFSFVPSDGVQRIRLRLSHTALPTSILRWAFYADGDVATLAPHAALAVAADVVVADEAEADGVAAGELASDEGRLSRISEVRDRYGFRIDADSQFAARWSFAEQWNENAVSLAPFDGHVVAAEIVLGATGLASDELVSGFVEVLFEELQPLSDSPVERVDTRRGSHSGDRFSRGNTIPAVAVPHGFTFVTPATDAADTRWPYRPYVHDDAEGRRLEALQFSHQPSPWIGDRGVLQLVPFAGKPTSKRSKRRRHIVPGSEVAHPHLYRAALDNATTVEMTATSHVGVFRITADDAQRSVGFIIDQPENSGRLTVHEGDQFDGWVREGAEGWGNPPRTYFAGVVLNGATSGVHGAVAGVGSIEVRIAVSFISIEVARHSLALEAGADRSFDDLVGSAAALWNPLLSAVSVAELPADLVPYQGLADRETRQAIASALYRMALYPNTAAENIGTADDVRLRFADPFVRARAHGESETGAPVAEGELIVNNGYWDTYRTIWPALYLLDPARASRLVDGLLAQYRRGGWMARWSAPGYVDSMVGTSSDQIFADAERWGVDLDAELAFDSGWRNACEPSPTPLAGRKGIDRGRFTGYISRDVHEGMSWSIENAISDAAMGRMATRLGDAAGGDASVAAAAGVAGDTGVAGAGPDSGADSGAGVARAADNAANDAPRWRAFARYFANRSLSYRTLFDPQVGFFRGRDASGSFSDAPFRPEVWGGDYVETNAWGLSVSAVHDGAGLARLYGGPTGLSDHLDRLMSTPERGDARDGGWYGTVIHEQREARALRAGMCGISNQPAHHIPWMWAHSDQPWRAGGAVNDLAGRLFSGAHIGQGFPGDEDNGEMSAWWLWSLLGLYPLELASGVLQIGSPLRDDVSVQRGDGSAVRVISRRTASDAHILRRAVVNGVELATPEVPIDLLQGGALIELEFSADERDALLPAAETARDYAPDLSSFSRGRVVASSDVYGAERVWDDGLSAEPIELSPGSWVGWEFDAPEHVSDVSVTVAAEASASALVWEVLLDGEWIAAPTTHTEALIANRTTPFQFATSGTARGAEVRGARARGDEVRGASVRDAEVRGARVRATEPVALLQLELFNLPDVTCPKEAVSPN